MKKKRKKNKADYPAIENKAAKLSVTLEEIQAVTLETDFSEHTQEIAIGVLIEGRRQTFFANKFGISNSAVHDALKRFTKAIHVRRERALKEKGFVRVSAYLPEYEAFKVEQLAQKYAEEINGRRNTNF